MCGKHDCHYIQGSFKIHDGLRAPSTAGETAQSATDDSDNVWNGDHGDLHHLSTQSCTQMYHTLSKCDTRREMIVYVLKVHCYCSLVYE